MTTSALHSAMRRTLLCALAAVLTLCLSLTALAAEDPIDAAITLSPDSLSAPGSVSVSIRVTNLSGEDMQNPVTLYDPAGKVVAGFGDGGSALLKADEFRTVTGSWNVTQDQLDAGEVVYTLRYKAADGGDAQVKAAAPIAYTGEKVDLQVTRTLSPEVVRSGGTASVVYELYNSGTVELTGIKVTEKITKTPQTITSIKAGEKKTLTFTAKMGTSDLTSSAKITYKAKGDSKTRELALDDLTVPVAVKGLNVTLSADKESVNIGDTVVLTMTVENKGNISYSDVSVTDAKLGTVFEGLSIAPEASFTKEKEVTVLEPTRYTFTLKLSDNTGMTNTLTTNSASVSAYDPEKELKLTLLLTCDKESIEAVPADAVMTLIVTNVSSVDCEKIAVTHGATQVTTIASLKAGESATVKRDYTLSQAGQFRFTATTKDTIGNEVSFESNTLSIAYAAPTVAPTTIPDATPAPLVTVPPATYDDIDSSVRSAPRILYYIMLALVVLFAASLVLFVASSVIRLRKKHQSNQAYDHLELGERRDYTEPAGEDTPNVETAGADGAPTDSDGERVILPHEKLLNEDIPRDDDAPDYDIPDPVPEDQLIRPDEVKKEPEEDPAQPETSADNAPPEAQAEGESTPDAAQPQAAPPAVAPETDGMGGYRMKRAAQTEPLDKAEDAQDAAQPAEPARKSRRRAAHTDTRDRSEEE